MMVIFVSECEKNALKRTRRVLDSFANRIGSNTWQTVITQEGLQTVKKMLRKTASKSTAVSCHWVRSRARSDFLWVVGNKNKFNHDGVVAVNYTTKKFQQDHHHDWKYLDLIQSLSAVAALLHDWGKASLLFQEKLKPESKRTFKGDPIRHEWVSTLLLHALVASTDNEDQGWLTVLANNDWSVEQLQVSASGLTQFPLKALPPLAKLVAWLIVSHHRLPLDRQPNGDLSHWQRKTAKSIDEMLDRVTQQWGYENLSDENSARVNECFIFQEGLLKDSPKWQQQLKKWAVRLKSQEEQAKQSLVDGSYRLVLHHARLSLMLGDHSYSSQAADNNWQSTVELYANSDRQSKQLKQKLDEHLVGVCAQAVRTVYRLPEFEISPPRAEQIKLLNAKSPPAFAWQDKAVTEITLWKKKSKKERKGFFAVNMASTGKGKTFANAKIMRALSSDGESLRFILALGLRTLTLQTGDEYRSRVGLASDELAVLIGSSAVKSLHDDKQGLKIDAKESSGSESIDALLSEDIDFDDDFSEESLSTVLKKPKDRQFLYAPVIACTIDHMMAATETLRGGRYILPALRLMSSDLVIDEVDDFVGDDLIAIGRLIHLAGMLGRKVMISSATITPDIARGYFNAYREGWSVFQKTREASNRIGCAWIDEFSTQMSEHYQQGDIAEYDGQHDKFIAKRIAKLAKQAVKRKAYVISCQHITETNQRESSKHPSVIESKRHAYFELIIDHAQKLHDKHHEQDEKTALSVSFGVVRMANIAPCVALTRFMLTAPIADDCEIRVMAYHSNQVLLMRHEQEEHLDQVLQRKEGVGQPPLAFSHSVIRHHLDQISQADSTIKNVIFIVVATPVEEVGRDHDFNWAIVEPSSYRSIIQLAGRVRRHREGGIDHPNIGLLQYNLKGLINLKNPKEKVFQKPGYEVFRSLPSHDLNHLMDVDEIANRLDATPRITPLPVRALKRPSTLAALEHYALRRWLAIDADHTPADLQGFLVGHWFLTALPPVMTPFRQSEPSIKIFLMEDENTERLAFHEWADEAFVNRQLQLNIVRDELTDDECKRLWLHRDYEQSILAMAEKRQASERVMMRMFGEMSFNKRDSGYYYNDQLGLYQQ